MKDGKDGKGWMRRQAAQIVGLLPEDDDEALQLLEMARAMLIQTASPDAGNRDRNVIRLLSEGSAAKEAEND
ncbi:hypothetical protein [Oricola sp.]|uniref:hypothetical protein n=1 Tax=Oricola sp. TaxID=1979950 RepID=UPI003BA867BF